ncbi:MAG: low molecular weight phosphotyrosine protein phosphatase [Clostridia bacterium]|nr:low molecular weight phosphotyrosine protein phosphatase [Clostridia bacterium]
MAEAVFKRICMERGMNVNVTSRGTLKSQEGSPVYAPAASVLKRHGYDFYHKSTLVTKKDVASADFILVMDSYNYRDVLRIAEGKNSRKVRKLGDFRPGGGDIDDPWYTRDFERAYEEIEDGCEGLADFLWKNFSAKISG